MPDNVTLAAQPPVTRVETSLVRSILQALRGEQHDYTTAPLNQALLLLAIPMVLEMLMESLFALSDVYWVSHLGKEAVAVVGLTEGVMSLVYAVAIGLSITTMAVVARRVGEKDFARASESAGQSIILGVTIAVLSGSAMAVFSTDILRWLGADASTIAQGSWFTRIMLGGNLTVFLIFVINAVFRGSGDPVFSMRTLWLANGLNIILGPCFIFGLGPFPRLGVTGAAVATNIGRGLGIVYQLLHLGSARRRVRVHLRDLIPRVALMRSILRPALSGMAQLLVSTTSWVGLFKIIALFGSSVLAGYTISIRIVISALLPSWGLANAGATLVGQNLGALQPDRAQAAVKIAVRANMRFLGSVGLVFFVFAPLIVRQFTASPEVLAYGVTSLRLFSLSLPLYAAGMCMEAAFNGAGDTWTPTRINFLCFWVCQIPLAWILSKPCGMGPLGIFISVPVAFSSLALLSYVAFRRGTWKKKLI